MMNLPTRSSCAQSDSTALLHRHTHSTEQCHTQALIYSNVLDHPGTHTAQSNVTPRHSYTAMSHPGTYTDRPPRDPAVHSPTPLHYCIGTHTTQSNVTPKHSYTAMCWTTQAHTQHRAMSHPGTHIQQCHTQAHTQTDHPALCTVRLPCITASFAANSCAYRDSCCDIQS